MTVRLIRITCLARLVQNPVVRCKESTLAEVQRKGAKCFTIETSNYGWELDAQHYRQMGGCYLLARGMGRPVANVRTAVKIPQSGTWHVWVRTRDGCPGHWQSPGRLCGQMGIAIGYAVALCKRYSVRPRDVGRKYIKKLRQLIGYV